MLLVAIPIVNYYHSMISSIIILVAFIYLIENMLIKDIIGEKFENSEKFVIGIIVIILIIISIKEILVINQKYYFYNEESPYYGSASTIEIRDSIEKFSDYVLKNKKEGVDVKIISPISNAIMVPLKINNGDMDLPFIGNFGKGGEEGLIEKISKLQNTKIMIVTDKEEMFWQESKKVRDYIIQNYSKVDELENFSVYYAE